MKKILALLILAISTVSCNADTTKAPEENSTPVVEKKEPETKKVCIKVWDSKANKEIEKCKNIKIHEKHEGTKVPK